jgi:hypothetical protein
VYETLENRVTSDKPITGREVTVDSDAHGTQLLLSRLKFKEGENFSVEELRRRMQWDLPILPDFQITINGEPVASKSIENATVFKVDKEGKHMGAIHGNLYLSNRKSPMPGIHVYVNGRKIGDPKTFFKGERFGATNQLVGIIHADGLEDAILFDRGRFREDHPGVIELGGVIEKAINAVEQYSRKANEGSMKGRVLASRSSMLKKAQLQIARTKLGGADRATTIEFSDSLDSEVPGHYVPDMKAIYLNSKHPSLVVDGLTTAPRYEQAVLSAVVDSIALSEIESSKDPLKRFLKRRGELWAQLTATSAQDEVKAEIHPMIMYQLSDLARITDRNLGAVKYLAEGEAFPVSEDGVLGKDFAEMQRTTRGFTTLYELVNSKLSERNGALSNFTSAIDRFHKILEGAGDMIVPFAYRLGSDKAQPCYVVEETCTDRVYNILRSPAMDMRRSDADPKRAFAEAYNEVHTIPELAKATSTNIDDVTKVIGFAKSRSLKIEVNRSTPVRFRFGDYVRVLQVRRKEDYERSEKAKH